MRIPRHSQQSCMLRNAQTTTTYYDLSLFRDFRAATRKTAAQSQRVRCFPLTAAGHATTSHNAHNTASFDVSSVAPRRRCSNRIAAFRIALSRCRFETASAFTIASRRQRCACTSATRPVSSLLNSAEKDSTQSENEHSASFHNLYRHRFAVSAA